MVFCVQLISQSPPNLLLFFVMLPSHLYLKGSWQCSTIHSSFHWLHAKTKWGEDLWKYEYKSALRRILRRFMYFLLQVPIVLHPQKFPKQCIKKSVNNLTSSFSTYFTFLTTFKGKTSLESEDKKVQLFKSID